MKSIKKLIFGNGKVPSVIKDKDTLVLSKKECDVTDYDNVLRCLKKYNPKTVINCAAKTNLEECELNKSESFNVNTLGAINLLKACANLRIKFIHISSGCLFDGNNSVKTEESVPEPRVWYTRTKTWADEFILNYGYDDYLILRPRQLITAMPHKSNMLTKFYNMDSIAAITEQNSLTCIEDFGDMINHLIDVGATGIYNCCNDGTVSPYEIAISIKEAIKPDFKVSKTSYEDFLSTLENKRVNTILSNEKLKSTGFNIRTAQEALAWCLENYSKRD